VITSAAEKLTAESERQKVWRVLQAEPYRADDDTHPFAETQQLLLCCFAEYNHSTLLDRQTPVWRPLFQNNLG